MSSGVDGVSGTGEEAVLDDGVIYKTDDLCFLRVWG